MFVTHAFAAAGFLLAFWYKKHGPQKKKYQWEIEEELGIEPPDFEAQLKQQKIDEAQHKSSPHRIVYTIKKTETKKDQE